MIDTIKQEKTMKTDVKAAATAATVPLKLLKRDPVNVRKNPGQEVPKFVASIAKRGVLVPLLCRPAKDGTYLVSNGGKRLDALMYLKSKKMTAAGVAVTDDFPVRIDVRDMTDEEARAASLTTNVIQASLHPVDEFEAFAAMVTDGATVKDIAAEFSMKEKDVRAALSLAAIAPKIRKAWRDGTIDCEAAEAYAQTKDLQHQERVFDKLKRNCGDTWRIDQEITGDARVDSLLKFVGEDAYAKAGHQVLPTLFDDREGKRVDNVPALKAMASKLLDEACEKLTKQGWGWAVHKDAAPKDVNAWRRLQTPTPTKDQMKDAGCLVSIGWDHKLHVEKGYVKPGVSIKLGQTAAQKQASAKARKQREVSGGLTNALAQRLSRQITLAAADALPHDPVLALRMLFAAMSSGESPLQVSISGMADLDGEDRHDNDFAAQLALAKSKTLPKLLEMLAGWTARSIDMVALTAANMPLTGDGADDALVLDAMSPKVVNAALRKRFDAADYFASVPKTAVLAALAEALPNLSVNRALPKAKIAEVAATHVPKTGWLPPEMRVAGYDGPKAKAKPKSSKKKRR